MADIAKNTAEVQQDNDGTEKPLLYGIDDSPPWILALLLGLQVCLLIIHRLSMFTSEMCTYFKVNVAYILTKVFVVRFVILSSLMEKNHLVFILSSPC